MTAQPPPIGKDLDLNNVTLEKLLRHMTGMNGRLSRLYEAANVSPAIPIELVPTAFKEVGMASEELQVAIEELQRQNNELVGLQQQLVQERDRYRELFELAPDAYLITTTDGVVREANRAAASLLNVAQRFLIGKPFLSFIPLEQRLPWQRKMMQLRSMERSQDWELPLQPREDSCVTVKATVSVVPNLGPSPEAEPYCLQWLIRSLPAERNPVKSLLAGQSRGSVGDASVHKYVKGELIPCKADAIWQVQEGLVKLSTFSENGEEVLLGIAGPSMTFGSGLTSLHVYQVTALTDEVQLGAITWQEIATKPELAQSLLSDISQRLQQSEAFLAVAGRRRVQDRLGSFLLLLKQEIGQPVSNGVRIPVRLTHEDLANACCTTRVTVTRLLGKLQQQGKITLDPKHYIILHD
ncbi:MULTISPECIES: helix-turn-helix domain-containing protein [Trichocoleus]|uniref:Helix-turn-helix domain-containing protein n=1 Tax=Trichocoleus desertorum GB2-A4 TaxID=2933944 RepID=A0ABV0J9A7_9CYAN|nr:helix-turn-helix domain-containing protein [Trichocoleus sp. FACHB-46]